MKNLLLVLLMVFTFSLSNAQTVNDIPISEVDVEYLQIVGTSKFMSAKLNIQIDLGQNTKFFSSGKETLVKGSDGKSIEFNSMVDALNFMSSNGYELIQAYVINVSNQNVYHYLMKRKLKE